MKSWAQRGEESWLRKRLEGIRQGVAANRVLFYRGAVLMFLIAIVIQPYVPKEGVFGMARIGTLLIAGWAIARLVSRRPYRDEGEGGDR